MGFYSVLSASYFEIFHYQVKMMKMICRNFSAGDKKTGLILCFHCCTLDSISPISIKDLNFCLWCILCLQSRCCFAATFVS